MISFRAGSLLARTKFVLSAPKFKDLSEEHQYPEKVVSCGPRSPERFVKNALAPARPALNASIPNVLYTQSPSAKVCRPSWIPFWR